MAKSHTHMLEAVQVNFADKKEWFFVITRSKNRSLTSLNEDFFHEVLTENRLF